MFVKRINISFYFTFSKYKYVFTKIQNSTILTIQNTFFCIFTPSYISYINLLKNEKNIIFSTN